jgi:tetratricopeptide (TPR) repeat protein
MNNRIKGLLVMAMVAVGVVDFCVYQSNALFRQAKNTAGPETKILLLEKAARIFPWNDQVFYELGKTQFEAGMRILRQEAGGRLRVKESAQNLERSLRLNPASAFGHFYYAQSLRFENLLSPSAGEDGATAAFENAARLAGENRELLFDVGKRLLSRWETLVEDERDFARDILAKALHWKPVDRFSALLPIWHLKGMDVGFLENIMPEDPRLFRMLGNYLGEKSMGLEDRHRILSRADQLEFAVQENLLKAANRELGLSHWDEAAKFFRWCLGNLPKIRFFHKISGQYPLADSAFRQVYASANLGLAQSTLGAGGNIEEVRDYLLAYLEGTEDEDSLKALETALATNGITDPRILLMLYHKQGRYEEIADAAGKMQDRPLPAEALYVVGDAYRRLGKIPEASAYFGRSLEKDTKNLEILLPVLGFYQKIKKQDEIRRINVMIERTVVSREKNFADLVIDKHKDYTWQLPFEGKAICVDLYFERLDTDRKPLITVEFNQEVIWDNFLEGKSLSFSVKTILGLNALRVVAVNHPVILKKMSYRYR